MSTNIQWTDETWNPTTGCAKVSAGCKNCYAEKMTKRLAAMGQSKYQDILTPTGKFNGKVRTHADELRKPLTWKKPRKVFVNSMSDLFHADVPFAFIDEVFKVMAITPKHTYQILTKRPERMAEYLNQDREVFHYVGDNIHGDVINWPLPNVWLGTSVENQDAADERIPYLLRCPAAVRFLSCEPLLGPLKLTGDNDNGCLSNHPIITACFNLKRGIEVPRHAAEQNPGIHWVIAGGESGSNARPMHPDWVRGLHIQCTNAGIPFFFKQWGNWAPKKDISNALKFGYFEGISREYRFQYVGHPAFLPRIGEDSKDTREPMAKMGKHNSGRLLDGIEHNEFPKTK